MFKIITILSVLFLGATLGYIQILKEKNTFLVDELQSRRVELKKAQDEMNSLADSLFEVESNIERIERVINQYEKANINPEDTYKIVRDAAAVFPDVTEDDLLALIAIESNFDPEATSWKGALGLMQLKPSTAREKLRKLGFKEPIDFKDPRVNVYLGAMHLQELVDRGVPFRRAVTDYNVGQYAQKESARNRYLKKFESAQEKIKTL